MSADRRSAGGEQRAGVDLTNLDQPLGPDAGATKRDLVDYLDAVADRILPGLAGPAAHRAAGAARARTRSCRRTSPSTPRTGCEPCRSGPRPPSGRCRYALCDDRRTLLWLANQRAIEYHPTLGLADNIYRPTHLVLDLDPPDERRLRGGGGRRSPGAAGARRLRTGGAVKTSGAKGVHVFVPIDDSAPVDDVAAATRALAARAEALDPTIATTAFIVEDRAARCSSTPPAPAARRSPPPTAPAAPGHAGVVSVGMVRSGPDHPGRLHGAHGARRPRRSRPVGGLDARAAATAGRPDRTWPHHPGRAGGRHARRQTPRPRPPGGRLD